MNKDKLSLNELDKLITEVTVDPYRPIRKPPVFITLKLLNKEYSICTKGNFSLIIGKAKTKKSFLASMLTASAINGGELFGTFLTDSDPNQAYIKYFDTEQSLYSVHRVTNRIGRMLGYDMEFPGLNKLPENFRTYSLRPVNTMLRLKLIEHSIYRDNEQIDLLVIDGVRDLISSINDEEQATMIADKLLKWSHEKQMHIIVVLHQNKGNDFARGHVGTELVNKAETVFAVEKNDEVSSIVKFSETRDETPPEFAFYINENGLPEIDRDYIPSCESKRNRTKTDLIKSFSKSDWEKFADQVFKESSDGFSYSQLSGKIKAQFTSKYESIGGNKAGEIISILKNLNIIGQSSAREPYRLKTNILPF